MQGRGRGPTWEQTMHMHIPCPCVRVQDHYTPVASVALLLQLHKSQDGALPHHLLYLGSSGGCAAQPGGKEQKGQQHAGAAGMGTAKEAGKGEGSTAVATAEASEGGAGNGSAGNSPQASAVAGTGGSSPAYMPFGHGARCVGSVPGACLDLCKAWCLTVTLIAAPLAPILRHSSSLSPSSHPVQ